MEEPVLTIKAEPVIEEEPSAVMQLVIKDEIPAAEEEPGAYQTKEIVMAHQSAEEPAMQDEVEQQKLPGSRTNSKIAQSFVQYKCCRS